MDLEDLKNVLNAKGKIIGFCGIFTEEEILQKIAELPIKKSEIRSYKFYGKSRNAARNSFKNSRRSNANL